MCAKSFRFSRVVLTWLSPWLWHLRWRPVSGSKLAWRSGEDHVGIPTSRVAVGKSFYSSEPQCFHLQKGHDSCAYLWVGFLQGSVRCRVWHMWCDVQDSERAFIVVTHPHSGGYSPNKTQPQKITSQHVLVRVWRNWSPCVALGRTVKWCSSVENAMTVPQQIKNRITLWPNNYF